MKKILLSTLNARYIHASLGLRYLKANMGELGENTSIREYDINMRPIDIAESLLAQNPAILGFGVYIWNVEETTRVVRLLKQISPEIILVVGGPEVSYEYDSQEIVTLADYLITGNADLAFHALCEQILSGESRPAKIIQAGETMNFWIDPVNKTIQWLVNILVVWGMSDSLANPLVNL